MRINLKLEGPSVPSAAWGVEVGGRRSLRPHGLPPTGPVSTEVHSAGDTVGTEQVPTLVALVSHRGEAYSIYSTIWGDHRLLQKQTGELAWWAGPGWGGLWWD